jgi:RNA polymerase sigma factor (sigma-70 family)
MAHEVNRRGAFEELFSAHYWAVRGYVLRRGPSASTEDVVAETFLIAWRRLDSLGDDPLPWLFGVARRVMANQQRAEHRRSALAARLRELVGGESSPWEPPAAMSEELAVAMIRLSPTEREALLLVAWEGLEPARAARAAGCSAAAFRARLHRARRHVTAALAETAIGPKSSIAGESS